MELAFKAPLQGRRLMNASVTVASGVSLAHALAAIASKPWTADSDFKAWRTFFGERFPFVPNALIDLISSGAFTIGSYGATYEVAANTPKTLTAQDLSSFEVVGTAVKVMINFGADH